MPVLPRLHLFVCTNTRHPGDPMGSCGQCGAQDVYQALRNVVADYNLHHDVWVTRTGCMSLCNQGPILVVYPQGDWYAGVAPSQAESLLKQYIPGLPVTGGDLPKRLTR